MRRAELQLGESVGVVGLGLIGQLVTQYAMVNGARRVVAIDPTGRRVDAAQAHGATYGLPVAASEARADVERITGGRMLDVVWDATGHPAALTQAVQLLRRLGRAVLVGDTPTPMQQPVGPGVLSNSISILGVHGSLSAPAYSEWTPWTRREITELFFDLLLQGRMRVSDLVSHRFAPAEAPAAYSLLTESRPAALGVMLDWGRA